MVAQETARRTREERDGGKVKGGRRAGWKEEDPVPAPRIYLTSWVWLLLLAQVAERGLGEEGNESGDGSGDLETFLSSSAQLWGNQRDEGGDSGSIGSLGCDFQLKSFQLEGCQKQKKQKRGHPGCLAAPGAASSPHPSTALSIGSPLPSHLIHQWGTIPYPTLWFKTCILLLAWICERAFKMLQPK